MSDSDGDYLFDSGNNSESDNEEMYCDELEDSDSDCVLSESEKNGSKNDEYPFEVVEKDKIVSQMSDTIKEVNGVTTIPEAKVKVLLNHFKWDKQKLMERFYADEQDEIFKEIIPIQADSANMLECEICFDTFKKGNMNGLDCGHFFCSGCYIGYLTYKIMQEGASQMIECPETKCHTIVDEPTLMSIVTDSKIKLKYQKLILDHYVQCNKLVKWCSAPDCSYAIKVTYLESRSVQCKCGNSFCFACYKDIHEPINCEMLKIWEKKSNDDSETCKWISVHTKDCPKCFTPIEKNGGCNHMSCKTTTCKYDFCWLCMKKWGSCNYDCNKFVEKEGLSLDEKRKELERFVFYSDRYLTHLNSLKFDKDLYKMAAQKAEEVELFNMGIQEAQFLKNAVDILCKCRKTLMYTYVFGFYLDKNNQKVIFEENQKDLESAIDTLSGYLEREVTSVADLKDMKAKVLDKSTYCELRRKVMAAHVYEGNDKDWWDFRG